tara:strand:- start:36 stop:3617 length:3582 start_codon:yes stop_codon:yes gene_type:complete
MADVRLIAYRKSTGSTAAETSDQYTSFELDLKEFPNISVNYQFSDIKNPETKKGNYSQTFKLPFTDNNNKFFENWFNVNISTQYFSTRKKFDATIFVGTVPQIEGYIQLKGVYKKAQYYDVVVFSHVADLFSTIGQQRLKDCLLLEDGTTYSRKYNHTFNADNLALSWNGSTVLFKNPDNIPLRDSTAGVQKVMYPMSVTAPNSFYYCNFFEGDYCTKRYLQMNAVDIAAYENSSTQQNAPGMYRTPIEQFKPAIQLKSLIKDIIGQAGFSYESNFIDGGYFGKLFMTTCGYLGAAGTPVYGGTTVSSGQMRVGVLRDTTAPDYTIQWGALPSDVDASVYTCSSDEGNQWIPFGLAGPETFDLENDIEGIYDSSKNFFTRKFEGMQSLTLRHGVRRTNIDSCTSGSWATGLEYKLVEVDSNGNELADLYAWEYNSVYDGSQSVEQTCPIDNSIMPVGTRFRLMVRRTNWEYDGSGDCEYGLGLNATTSGASNTFYTTDASGNLSTIPKVWSTWVLIEWSEFDTGTYGQEIDIPSCIDPTILQKDFLKDIIERFNLVVTSKSGSPSTLIIEPYAEYMRLGQQRHWTDKLDLSKEVIVKDTTSLQKKEISFTDKEDVDIINKEFKEMFPEANVYGKKEVLEVDNEFAKGTMKNKPLFSPYINEMVYQGGSAWDIEQGTALPNMIVQYEFSYSETDEGIENKLEKTNSKLFYYNGAATTVKDDEDATVTYNLHSVSVSTGAVTAHAFTTYPVCSPYNITPVSNAYTLTSANQSLYWGGQPPIWGNSNMFNWTSGISWENNSLYGKYWRPYLQELYNEDARIMECYLNLNEVDMLNFQFNDEIFIKDAYWRVQKIQNYQVGGQVSTKVTLLKIVDTLLAAEGCSYVIGQNTAGDSIGWGYYLWCPSTNPSCTPDTTAAGQYEGLYTNPQCCLSRGGEVIWNVTTFASSGRYLCKANAGSRPLPIQNINRARSMFSGIGEKTFTSRMISGSTNSLIQGSDTSKYSRNLVASLADDIVVKYSTEGAFIPRLQGESHRIVLSGYTEGTTRGYAYTRGQELNPRIILPPNGNTMVGVTAMATVIGGTNSTYVQGVTETVRYDTAFRTVNGTTTQVGTAGGVLTWSIKELGTTCSLYIDVSGGELRFGLDDSQTDTKRIWTLNVELTVQFLENIGSPFGVSYALWQNTDRIQFQNGINLEWN